MKALSRSTAAAVVLAASASLASATPVTPGNTVTASSIAGVSGTTVASVSGPVHTAAFSGTYTETVVRDTSNPFNSQCGSTGCLTFIITANNISSSTNGFQHISNGDGNGGFAPYDLNVGYEVNGAYTHLPTTVDEATFGTVEFDFYGGDSVAPGDTTAELIIQTSASNYTTGSIGFLDAASETVTGFVPTAATPEPSSLALLSTGLLGVASVLRKRRA